MIFKIIKKIYPGLIIITIILEIIIIIFMTCQCNKLIVENNKLKSDIVSLKTDVEYYQNLYSELLNNLDPPENYK